MGTPRRSFLGSFRAKRGISPACSLRPWQGTFREIPRRPPRRARRNDTLAPAIRCACHSAGETLHPPRRLKAGAGATTSRTAPGRCLELTLFDAVLLSPSPRCAARLVGWLVWQGDAGDGVSCPGRDHKVSRPVSPAFARVADPSCPRRQKPSDECLACASGR